MTALSARMPPARSETVAWRPGSLALALLVGCPLALFMSWPRIVEIWQTGSFFDTDDAMRMVQVRDWLAGQAWFDLVAHRMDPPAGVPMHWSRVVDVPIAALVRLFDGVTDPVHAERLARIAFPVALQAGMIAATAFVARILAGPRAVLPAALLILLSGISYGQFQPGRIDHHAPQILLLMLATGATLAGLDPSRARWGALSGVFVALSLAISLENLPFFAVLLAVLPLAWAIGGAPHRPALVWLALGLGAAAPALFAATVAPDHYGVAACDAYSVAHLTALISGAAGLAALALASPRLAHPAARAGAVAGVGGAVLAIVHAAYPACLAGPYANMDPLLERLWLRHVSEAQPLWLAIRTSPDTFTMLVCPILVGLGAAILAACRTRGRERARWCVVAAVVAIGLMGTGWELRVVTSTSPLALLAGAWAAARATDLALARSRPAWILLPVGLVLPFGSLAWAMIPVPDGSRDAPAEPRSGLACRRAAAVEPLAALPPETVFAPIDSGSHLLVHTGVRVLAAPYHRNRHGNLTVLRGFLADPAAARAIVETSGATLLAFCPMDSQMMILAGEAPDGLASRLMAGRVPDWLTPLPIEGTPYRVFRVR